MNKELKNKTIIPNYEAEANKLRCQCEESKQYIKTLEDKINKMKEESEKYELLKKMIKVFLEGL